MITIKNVKTLSGEITDYQIPSSEENVIEAKGELLLFPGVIDPHISFGPIDSPDWSRAVETAIRGGITTVVDIPREVLLHSTKHKLEEKNNRIKKLLLDSGFPINHSSYLFYSESNLEEIDQIGMEKGMIKGIVIYLEEGEILDHHWDNLFRLAAQEDIPIIINSSSENAKQWRLAREGGTLLEKALFYVEKWSNRLYVLNVATQKEIELIQEARKRALLVYAETTPQYLFPDDISQATHLWEALNSHVIETLGSGYLVNQKDPVRILYKGANFSLSDPLFFLPFLLTAASEKKISLDKLAHLTSYNTRDILELNRTHDFVLIDLEKEQTIQKIYPDHSINIRLKGWPVCTILQGHVFPSPLEPE